MFSEPERSGQVIDQRYRVLSRLGQGGMGTVYVAEHIGLNQRRAIKFLHPEVARHPSARKRFLQEAQVVASLRHEHVIEVMDLGETGGAAYYVMELLEGEDLRALLRREKRLPWPRVRTIMLQICEALHAAHARRITHRDLKPENCFRVRRADGVDFIKLLDFGVAKVAQDPGNTQLTGTGEPLGTVGYMALEQFLGQADPRSDIYALGVMMYEMLAGRMPYQGNSASIVIQLNNGSLPPPLHDITPDVSPALSALVQRAMEPRLEERYPDVAALVRALRELPESSAALAPATTRHSGSPAVETSGPTLMAAEEPARSMISVEALTEAALSPSTNDRTVPRISLAVDAAPQIAGAVDPAIAFEEALTQTPAPRRVAEASLPALTQHFSQAPLVSSPLPDSRTLFTPPGRRRGLAMPASVAFLLLAGMVIWWSGFLKTTSEVPRAMSSQAPAEPTPRPTEVRPAPAAIAEQPPPGEPLPTPTPTPASQDADATGSTGSPEPPVDSPVPTASVADDPPLSPVPETTTTVPKPNTPMSRDDLEDLLNRRLRGCNRGMDSASIIVEAAPAAKGKAFASLKVSSFGKLRDIDHDGVNAKLAAIRVIIKSKATFSITLPVPKKK